MLGGGAGSHLARRLLTGSPALDLQPAPETGSTGGKRTIKERLINFTKNPSLDNPQLCRAVNRVHAVAWVVFHALVAFAGEMKSVKFLEANCQSEKGILGETDLLL